MCVHVTERKSIMGPLYTGTGQSWPNNVSVSGHNLIKGTLTFII